MSPSTDAMRRTAPSIKIDGTLLDARTLGDLLSMRIVRGTRSTGRATFTLVDRTFQLARSAMKIGAAVEISAIEPATLVFKGTITAVATEIDRDGARAVVTAHDKTYEMARRRGVETYTNQTATDVLGAIARSAGLKITTPGSGGKPEEWSWRTDSLLGQLDQLCERLGWEWTVEDDTIVCVEIRGLRIPASACTLELDKQLLRFSAEQSKPVSTEVTVRGWDPGSKATVTASATTPTESGGYQASGAGGASKATSLVTRRLASTAEEARILAESLAAAAATVHARGRAEFSPLVAPGRGVTIKGAGPSDGTYYVREVEHVSDGGALRTSFVAGFRPPSLLSDPWQTGRTTGVSPFASGVHVGLVRDVKDPASLGRVRVQLPSLSEKDDLAWARVLVPGGGAGRGIQWLPEIGDEVLVAFEDGDARRPVVVGGLHNAKDLPPVRHKDKATVETRSLVSRRGHKIEFGDGEADDAQYVDIVLGGGTVRLHVGADRIDLETQDKPLRIASGGDEIVFDGKGTITIKAKNIKLQATQDVTVEGTGVKAKGSGQVAVEGASTTVKASSALKLQSSGIAELSGSMVKIN